MTCPAFGVRSNPLDSIKFTAPNNSGNDVNSSTYFIAATGLSDAFTLDGVLNMTGTSKGDGVTIFAAVPEPATVVFGLALVGGLGLLEIRRRKIS